MKYDDHYDLEDVCADIYRKCANSIMEKCKLDNLEFTNYVEEIIGDDLEMKNVAMKKLMNEFTDLTGNAVLTDEMAEIKKQLNDLREKEQNYISEKKQFSLTHKKDKDEIDFLKTTVNVLQKKVDEPEKEIPMCSNCRWFKNKCKCGESLNHLYAGMKVRSHGHSCLVFPGGAQSQELHVPWGTVGIKEKEFGIVWDDGKRKIVCNCNKSTSTYSKIVYFCR